MISIKPDWRPFASCPWTANILPYLDALGVEDDQIPFDGRPREFRAADGRRCCISNEGAFVVSGPECSQQVAIGEVIQRMGLRWGYSDDRALRRWLRLWGWTPPAKSRAVAPADDQGPPPPPKPI